jgi:hypothetical protein
MGDLQFAIPVLTLLFGANVWLWRRFRRTDAHTSPVYHMAAAIAVSLGALTLMAGIGHSVAVIGLALSEPEYGTLQVLRLTTGALLVYSGAMGVALFRAIKSGQHLAIAVAAASASLFVVYLLVIRPIGGADTVPPMLALWSIYLVALTLSGAVAMRGRLWRMHSVPPAT